MLAACCLAETAGCLQKPSSGPRCVALSQPRLLRDTLQKRRTHTHACIRVSDCGHGKRSQAEQARHWDRAQTARRCRRCGRWGPLRAAAQPTLTSRPGTATGTMPPWRPWCRAASAGAAFELSCRMCAAHAFCQLGMQALPCTAQLCSPCASRGFLAGSYATRASASSCRLGLGADVNEVM